MHWAVNPVVRAPLSAVSLFVLLFEYIEFKLLLMLVAVRSYIPNILFKVLFKILTILLEVILPFPTLASYPPTLKLHLATLRSCMCILRRYSRAFRL